MANVHVLQQLSPGRFRVVYHIAVPATNNAAGVPWKTCVAANLTNPTSVLPDGDGTNGTISAAEKALIASGAIYELVREEKGQSAATINSMFSQRRDEVLASLQATYQQFGRTI